MILFGTSEAGNAWVDKHLRHEESVEYAGGVAVEHSYLGDILEGLTGESLAYGKDYETRPALVRA